MSDEAPRSTALARLESEGELVVSEGSFSLDANAARAKLADFRLADPHAWVLLVVEAAELLADASELRVQTSNLATSVEIVGAELDEGELRGLFDHVLGARRGRGRAEALRRLAIACHTAAGLEGRLVELRCPSLVLVLDGDGVREREAGSASEPEGPCIELIVRDMAFGAALTAAGPERERELLRMRAAYAGKPVILDDERISGGFGLHACLGVEAFGPERGPGRGRVGWDALGYRSGVFLVANGVIIERLDLSGQREHVAAIVDASQLERDLSMSRFVRDDAFYSLVEAAQAAHDRFDLDALERPLVRGWLPSLEGPLVQRAIFSTVFGVLCMTAGPALASVLAASPLPYVAAFLVLGVALLVRALHAYTQLPRTEPPTHASQPGIARLRSSATVLRSFGPATEISLTVDVCSADRAPQPTVMHLVVPTEQVESFAPGQWLWIHLFTYVGYERPVPVFDTQLSNDRPAGALAATASGKALPAATHGP